MTSVLSAAAVCRCSLVGWICSTPTATIEAVFLTPEDLQEDLEKIDCVYAASIKRK